MFTKRWTTTACTLIAACLIAGGIAPPAAAQNIGRQPVSFKISGPSERLEMIVNTSRILTTTHKIPRLLVENQTIVRAQPIAPNQVQLSAIKPGFTSLTVWDENDNETSVDLLVYGDARELENLLMTEFPEASLRVRPLATSVIISGYVPRADMVSRIVQMGQDYYPNVINNITVGGVQQILLHVKLMEVSRTKLRKMGFDWASFNNNGGGAVQNASGLLSSWTIGPNSVASNLGETLAFGIINDDTSFLGFLEALRQYNLVKVLAEPTLVTVSGRPASFSSGGEFPILVPQSLGTVSIEYRQFGTRVDFVPIVLGNGRVRLEVRPQVSEVDPTRGITIGTDTVPGLRSRWVDTAVEMNAGQTLALAGLIQTQVEAENKGLPYLSDLPWVGAAFRRVQEQNNEVELLVLVTPEFVDALDPHEVPPFGPGQLTVSPNDAQLYDHGFLEVEPCCPDGSCVNCQGGNPNQMRMKVSPHEPKAASYPVTSVRRSINDRTVPQGRANPYNRSRPVIPASARSRPGLIGPAGYDVLD